MTRSRRYGIADRMIINLDRAVRSIGGRSEGSGRANPGHTVGETALSAREKRTAAALMRVNHAGEVAAQALYHGQALTAGTPDLREALATTGQIKEEIVCRPR